MTRGSRPSGRPRTYWVCIPSNLRSTRSKIYNRKSHTRVVVGVADGVGGWIDYGIDPGEFSTYLMKTCERFVTSGKFNPSDPIKLLASSYYEIFENKRQIFGKIVLELRICLL